MVIILSHLKFIIFDFKKRLSDNIIFFLQIVLSFYLVYLCINTYVNYKKLEYKMLNLPNNKATYFLRDNTSDNKFNQIINNDEKFEKVKELYFYINNKNNISYYTVNSSYDFYLENLLCILVKYEIQE